MGAIEANISTTDAWHVGEDRNLRFDVVDSAGNAQALTGWSLRWELKQISVGTALLTKDTSTGIVVGNGTAVDDRATVTVTRNDTISLAAGRYYHQLVRTDEGNRNVLAYGWIMLMDADI